MRLRLYLSYLWLAASPPHELRYPARAWAELLDLEDPENGGARRISDAVRWLERHHFIEVEARSGGPNVVRLLSDDGSGKPYELPGAAYNRLRGDAKAAAPHRYVQLPPELWTSGWIAVLSPAALAMLIILRVHAGADPGAEVWIAPDYASTTYMLAEETRTRGLRELGAAGLVTIRRRQLVTTDSFDFRRFRNVYQLNLRALPAPASVPLSSPETPLSDVARLSPSAAIIQAFSVLEVTLRRRLLDTGLQAGRATIGQLTEHANRSAIVTPEEAEVLAGLVALRNRAAHGRAADITVDEALKYLKRAKALNQALAADGGAAGAGKQE